VRTWFQNFNDEEVKECPSGQPYFSMCAHAHMVSTNHARMRTCGKLWFVTAQNKCVAPL
jgi:hypothetical protein